MKKSAVYQQLKARKLAVAIIYQRQKLGHLGQSEKMLIDQLKLSKAPKEYLEEVLGLHLKHEKTWVGEIQAELTHWKTKRLQPVLKCILLQALAEMAILQKPTERKASGLESRLSLPIIIDESLKLTETFLGTEAKPLCNKILQLCWQKRQAPIQVHYDEA